MSESREKEAMMPKCPFCGKNLVKAVLLACEEYFCHCEKWQESGFKLTRG